MGSVSYWQAERDQVVGEPASAGQLQGAAETDIAIIGAGITGTSAALWLARAGAQVAIVEARAVAAGASGRNGGFLLGGTSETYVDSIERYGHERSKRIWAFSQANNALAVEIIAALGASGWSCGYQRTGSLRIAASEEEFAEHHRSVALLAADGWHAELVERAQLPACLQSHYQGGIYYPEDGEIQPALLVTGLARLARDAGAVFYDHSPVSAIERTATGFIVQTPIGTLNARTLILAANAWLPEVGKLLGADWLAQHIEPTRGQMLATAPVSERLFECPCYANEGYEYFRQLADGRLVIGGWRNTSFATEYTSDETAGGVVQDQLERFLRETLRQPQAQIERRWAGIMAFSSDGLPLIGNLPGVPGCYIAGGYTGHGNAYALLAARMIAGDITGRSQEYQEYANLFAPERLLAQGEA
jgi:glycine/D-amino acid oxidase-like deaminating enzyme